MPEKPKVLLIDANVLIDYQKSDFSVLELANKHIAEVYILTTVIEEVDGLEINDCERFGLKMIEPELEQIKSAVGKRGQMSLHDHLCLLVASESDFICVTNDKPLRKACAREGVDVLWGLEIMSDLVRAGVLRAASAIDTAEKIHLCNPLHITKDLVKRFGENVTDIERKL